MKEMHVERAKQSSGKSGPELRIKFSPNVRAAFGDLAASVHFSMHFDPDIRLVVQSWASENDLRVSDVIVAYPAIAWEAMRHIEATGDEHARAALNLIRHRMPENGFILSEISRPAKRRLP